MSDELKPCPFCGGEARLDQRTTQSLWNSNDAVFSHVVCDECDISGQDFCDDPEGEEAIEWWNRRAQPKEQEQFTGKLGALKKAAKGACSYSEEDWFHPESLWSCMEPDDAEFVSAASPFTLLALIAAFERISDERDSLAAARMAYASEFAPDENGDPNVGSVHENIRELKAERDKIDDDRKLCWKEFMALVRSSSEKERYLQEEIDQLRAKVERLRKAFGECIQSLHDEMLQSYGGQKPNDMHPVTRRNYDRDMEEIAEYRAAMTAKEAEKKPT